MSSIILFWAGPFTPAVPLQIALIFALSKIHKKIKTKRQNRKQKKETQFFDENGNWIYKGEI